ncbi:AAA family ATPase [Alcanivorax sp.]|jgi:pilus assembly protein CpaE|uniref:AAA family ATPase n=1 Tax=Alcanivorax sp. TaxID=1872427 RepID=UPI003A900A54
MSDHDIVLSVVDDDGIEAWLDRVVEEPFRLEQVSRSDLTRVLRLLEATTAHVVMVEISETDMDQSLAIITALTSARPWVTVITVCARSNQELLLQAMRAGARDCFVAGTDAGDVRERLRRHQLLRVGHYGDEVRSGTNNLTLVASASPTVDTRFLAQNVALSLNRLFPEQRCLAIDTQPGERGIFYLDVHNEYNLENLLASPETLDETLIGTALEEYRPGLRLLAGGVESGDLAGDRSADLFIALNHLMQMFDRIVINVGTLESRHWVRALGIHARHLLVAMHPLVDQAHAVRSLGNDWRSHLGRDSQVSLIVDGVDSHAPPGVDELAETAGVPLLGGLPMDWRYRLLAMNSGLPIQEQSPRSRYSRNLQALIGKLEMQQDDVAGSGWWQRLRSNA